MFNDEMIYKIRNKKYAIIKISDINAIKNMIYNGQIWLLMLILSYNLYSLLFLLKNDIINLEEKSLMGGNYYAK